MIKVAVSGASGRMGRGIISKIIGDDLLELSGALEHESHRHIGQSIGGVRIVSDITKIGPWDVLVEFASPQAALSHLPYAAKSGRSAVVGATGFSASEYEKMISFGSRIPILAAPNMSVGVNIMLKIASIAAGALGEDYDMEVIEMHHKKKKDSPSGTAVRIAEVIAEARKLKLEEKAVYGRHGLGERTRGEIGVHALRGGTVAGEHTVVFAGDSERLEITHRAENRDIFVFGTIKAVKFIAGAAAGVYSMEDVIGA